MTGDTGFTKWGSLVRGHSTTLKIEIHCLKKTRYSILVKTSVNVDRFLTFLLTDSKELSVYL